MCGIAGALDRTGTRRFPPLRLTAMLAAIAHRGPDDEAAHHEPGLALGARRLSIVDLSGGRQPIANEDETVWVAFNGELFEYPELRQELLARGHRLATRCDTETWVHLYEEHGLEMLERARGQFAVALWDVRRRRLVLGRDRFGICPLYYAEHDGWLLWASEIKALFASGLIEPQPDAKGIDYFCNFFSAPLSRTCFEGVRMLPPGHLLEAAAGRLALWRYWDLDFPAAGEERRDGPLVDELEARLERAVERRLHGDVPVACYISGGLDSTVVLGLASRRRGGGVRSFSIGLARGTGPDESRPAAEAAEILGSPLTSVSMDAAAIARAYPELLEATEVPVLDTSCACMMRLAAVVHEHGFKVVLTGEGADEALAGYPWFKAQRLARMIPAVVARRCRDWTLRAVGALDIPPSQGSVRTAQHLLFELAGAARSQLYAPAMWERLGEHQAWDDLDIDWSRLERWHPLNQSLYVGYKAMLAGMQLFSKGDRVAMHSSVETRYPYLDEDVVEWCATIAPDYKLRRLTEKWILRQVAARTLPQSIAGRRKTMFRAKLSPTFLGAERPPWVDQLLSPESLRAAGWFDPAAVARARVRRFGPSRMVLDLGLMCVVTVQLWHHMWCGGRLCELPAWAAPLSPGRYAAGV